KRADGVVFAVNTNRVTYPQLSKSQFARMVSDDAELYGTYVYEQKDSDGNVSISFSREQGFYAGEYSLSILKGNSTENAIYAEEFVDADGDHHFICIVIIEGKVVSDFDLSYDMAKEDLVSLLASNDDKAFTIFCAIDESLIRKNSSGKTGTLFNLDDQN